MQYSAEKTVNYIKQNSLYKGDKYTEFIAKNLPLKRVKHTADVVITALKKVKPLGLDYQKVKIATTLHDCAKYLDYKTVEGFTLPEGVPAPVEHAFLGAFIAEKVLGVTDDGGLVFNRDGEHETEIIHSGEVTVRKVNS